MGYYVEEKDFIAEGLPSTVSPALLNRRINKWEELVESLTKQYFRAISPGPLVFDGNNSHLLHFSIPLISVSSLQVNGQSSSLPSSMYRAHVGRVRPKDDRQNPKIELLGVRSRSIFRTSGSGMFLKGLDQVVTATWGYLDIDGNCPSPVKDAIVELVVLDLNGYWDKSKSGLPSPITALTRERTDGHEVEFQRLEEARLTWTHLPGHIQSVLANYRGPWAMAAPEATFVTANDALIMSF